MGEKYIFVGWVEQGVGVGEASASASAEAFALAKALRNGLNQHPDNRLLSVLGFASLNPTYVGCLIY